jgi:hypothetical protein
MRKEPANRAIELTALRAAAHTARSTHSGVPASLRHDDGADVMTPGGTDDEHPATPRFVSTRSV